MSGADLSDRKVVASSACCSVPEKRSQRHTRDRDEQFVKNAWKSILVVSKRLD